MSEFEETRVEGIMTRSVIYLSGDLIVGKLLDKIVEYHHIGYPVVDEANR